MKSNHAIQMKWRLAILRACLIGSFAALACASGPVERAEAAEPSNSSATLAATAGAGESWHAMSFISSESVGVRVIHYWSKGPWMRAETVINGRPIVTIVRDSEYIVYSVADGKGARIRRPKQVVASDATRVRPFGNDLAELQAQGAERIDETLEAGRRGEVWSITDTAGRRKLWVSQAEPRLPIRLETFIRGTSETVRLDYQNWSRGLPLEDAFFEPPPNLDLENFDYASYVEASSKRPVDPVLYPDLLMPPAP